VGTLDLWWLVARSDSTVIGAAARFDPDHSEARAGGRTEISGRSRVSQKRQGLEEGMSVDPFPAPSDYLTFGALAASLPPGRNGRPVSPTTIHRYRRHGQGGRRLRAEKVGGRWMTTHEWFHDFVAERTADELAAEGSSRPSAMNMPRDHTEAELEKEGF
jgi:hypothetical protein